MKYEAKAWKETEGACLRNFNEQAQIDSVNGALALRPQIEKIIDQIWDEGFDGIYFIGIGGTYASSMQVEVYMRGRSKLPVFVEIGKVIGVDLGVTTLLGWFVLASLLINEIRSIVENFVEAGFNVPAVLVKGLEVADKVVNKDQEEE